MEQKRFFLKTKDYWAKTFCNSTPASLRLQPLTCFQMRTNLVPRVFSLFNMAAAREKTLAHSRSRVSNEDGDVFKMAATAKRVRRTGYEMLR